MTQDVRNKAPIKLNVARDLLSKFIASYLLLKMRNYLYIPRRQQLTFRIIYLLSLKIKKTVEFREVRNEQTDEKTQH